MFSGAASGGGAVGVSVPDGGLLAPVGGGPEGDSCGGVRCGMKRLKGKKLKGDDRGSVEGLSAGAGAGAGPWVWVGPGAAGLWSTVGCGAGLGAGPWVGAMMVVVKKVAGGKKKTTWGWGPWPGLAELLLPPGELPVACSLLGGGGGASVMS